MARKKAPKAQLWQVWMYSAADNGVFWLYMSTKDYEKAAAAYNDLRAGYYKAEFRTPLGAVIASYDVARVDSESDHRWIYDVTSTTVLR